jgi:tetratricopeptide (TPR) repeat protein
LGIRAQITVDDPPVDPQSDTARSRREPTMLTERIEDLPGRNDDLALLFSRYAAMASSGHGEVVFLSGDEGSGRTTLLDGFEERLTRHHPEATVIAGEFRQGQYVAWQTEPVSARLNVVLAKLSAVVELAGIASDISPIANLIKQALTRGGAALTLVDELIDGLAPQDLGEFPVHILRRLCECGPVVCIIDHADTAATGWWDDLVWLAGRYTARELPLLMVLGVDGPDELGPDDGSSSNMLYAARSLSNDDLAQWHALGPISADDLRSWVGSVAPNVIGAVLTISKRRAGYAAALWHKMVVEEAIEQRADGRWEFTATRQRGVDAIAGQLGKNLRAAFGNDNREADRARVLLHCGALEGRRFTLEAVATATGRQPVDVLSTLGRLEGMLTTSGSLSVTVNARSSKPVSCRFASELDWLTFRYHGFSQRDERRYAGNLVDGLLKAYGNDQAFKIAPKLARLSRLAGDDAGTRHYTRMGEAQISRAAKLWRAKMAIGVGRTAAQSDQRRAARSLIDAGLSLVPFGPSNEGLHYALAAQQFDLDPTAQATAIFCVGAHRLSLGDRAAAGDDLQKAFDLANKHEIHWLQVSCLDAMGLLAFRKGDSDTARSCWLTMRDVARQHGERTDEAFARQRLAMSEHQRGNCDWARSEILEVLSLQRKLRHPEGQISGLTLLSELARVRCEYSAAEQFGQAALDLAREICHHKDEVWARLLLARIADDQHDFVAARAELLAARDRSREIGHCIGELHARRLIARSNARRGAYDEARDELRLVATMAERAGNLGIEAAALCDLARLDIEGGRFEAAEASLSIGLTAYKRMGDPAGIARARNYRAWIQVEQGEDRELARAELLAVLETFRKLGDPIGQAATHHQLARIAAASGEVGSAKISWDRALDLYRQTGYREGEATVRTALARQYLRDGDDTKARENLIAAVDLRQLIGNPHHIVTTMHELAELDEAHGTVRVRADG